MPRTSLKQFTNITNLHRSGYPITTKGEFKVLAHRLDIKEAQLLRVLVDNLLSDHSLADYDTLVPEHDPDTTYNHETYYKQLGYSILVYLDALRDNNEKCSIQVIDLCLIRRDITKHFGFASDDQEFKQVENKNSVLISLAWFKNLGLLEIENQAVSITDFGSDTLLKREERRRVKTY
jgi:hypothetical protein